MKLLKKLKKTLNIESYTVNEIEKTIISACNDLTPELDINFYMNKNHLLEQISELILREDNKTGYLSGNGFETIISCSYWPENLKERQIYRFVIKKNVLIGIFVEIGVDIWSIEEIYNLVLHKLASAYKKTSQIDKDPTGYSVGHKKDENKYPTLTWENKNNYMFMKALRAYPTPFNRRSIINRYVLIDEKSKVYFGWNPHKIDDHIEGMFIIKSNHILPSFSVLITPSKQHRDNLKNYLINNIFRFPKTKL